MAQSLFDTKRLQYFSLFFFYFSEYCKYGKINCKKVGDLENEWKEV